MRVLGIPNEEFIKDKRVPMTREEIRGAIPLEGETISWCKVPKCGKWDR